MKLGQLISMDGGELLPPELSAILARPAETGTSQNSSLAATLPPLVELAHDAVGGEKLRAACIKRDDLITYAASLARDSAP